MKSPSFQFYPADFLSDENVVMMSNRELGCYMKLMCYCWREGSIPADMNKIARLCGEDGSAMADLWTAISGCFDTAENDASRLVHFRLEKERNKQTEYKKERSDSGRKGAESRWGKASKANGSAIAQPLAEPMANDGLSSSSSSSTSENIDKPKPKKKTALIDDLITPDWLTKATDYGMTEKTAENEIGKFKNHHFEKKTVSENWIRQWDTWCRNWVSYGSKQAGVTSIGQAARPRARNYVN
jgi:uncharacterized protein YdaU (DUF1376 family)